MIMILLRKIRLCLTMETRGATWTLLMGFLTRGNVRKLWAGILNAESIMELSVLLTRHRLSATRVLHLLEFIGKIGLVDWVAIFYSNDKKAAVFEDCPHWVLENLAYKKKFFKRAEMIDRITYERAMEVSDYNR